MDRKMMEWMVERANLLRENAKVEMAKQQGIIEGIDRMFYQIGNYYEEKAERENSSDKQGFMR